MEKRRNAKAWLDGGYFSPLALSGCGRVPSMDGLFYCAVLCCAVLW